MQKKNHTLLLGAHMSIAGGFEKAIERGESIGCTTIQIFTKSNRQWRAKNIELSDANKFKQALKASSIKIVVAHATYLINLGSPNNETRDKSVNALTQELQRCDLLGIPYLILHPGSHLNADKNTCISQIAAGIDKVFAEIPNTTTKLLLETMAGQGSSVGHTFEQIAKIIQLSSSKKRLGVCLDTCHVFAAGYNFGSYEQYNAMWDLFEKTIGLNKLKTIHINDSKKECGSRVDRHENIGKGKISLEAFSLLLNDERFFDIPKILETPKDNLEDDVKNITTLKALILKKNKQLLSMD